MVAVAPFESLRPVRIAAVTLAWLLALCSLPIGRGLAVEASADHLVVSEVMTGGASASDEFIEIHNPTATALPLDGLELVYVSASGTTVSRRAAWTAEMAALEPGAHLLVANEAGLYAADADATYASGMSATGGSVALREVGATSAIDAVGWGTASSTWREGAVAPAPPAGASLERLPGGALGSGQDTDDNLTDFAERAEPDPQNLAAPPTPGTGTGPDPTGPLPSPTPTGVASPTPSLPTVVSVSAARALPDGSAATVEAFALTASDFHDGGGYVADASGGIAVLVDQGTYGRGSMLRLHGTLDDRFSQRTLRVGPGGVTVIGAGADPAAAMISTGDVGETVEGRLVRVVAPIVSTHSSLTSGVALDVDDGSGPARVIVGSALGIDLGAWVRGATVDLVGVVGQRDSTGTGAEGYRIMPRDSGDVRAIAPPATETPTPTPSLSPTPAPTASPLPDGVVTIAEARAAARNARLTVRGVVTLGSGIVDGQTAVIQDATGAIALRLGDEAGALETGQSVQVSGARSTKSGMETLRVAEPAVPIDAVDGPGPARLATGAIGEEHEALLVTVAGTLATSARRASAGSVTLDVDDGSGPLRIHVPAALEYDDADLVAGVTVEVTGVVGQETTGAQPLRGYRVWPRSVSDIDLVTTAGATTTSLSSGAGAGSSGAKTTTGTLAGAADGEPTEGAVAATLVAGPWPELGIGGLLWDGTRLVALAPEAADQADELLGDAGPPLAVDVSALTPTGRAPDTGIAMVSLDEAAGSLQPVDRPPVPPTTELPSKDDPAVWVALVGTLDTRRHELRLASERVTVEVRCDQGATIVDGTVRVIGIAIPKPSRILVPCAGLERAPVLGGLQPRASTGVESTRPPSAELAAASSRPRREAVAGLLGVGALLVAAGAWTARRLRDRPEAMASMRTSEPAGEARVARLRLLHVPREHGS